MVDSRNILRKVLAMMLIYKIMDNNSMKQAQREVIKVEVKMKMRRLNSQFLLVEKTKRRKRKIAVTLS
jgi:hypothetical protein